VLKWSVKYIFFFFFALIIYENLKTMAEQKPNEDEVGACASIKAYSMSVYNSWCDDYRDIRDDIKSEFGPVEAPEWLKNASFNMETARQFHNAVDPYVYIPKVAAFSTNGFVRTYTEMLLSNPRRGKALGNMVKDLTAGLTVAVMLIPQGLAYGALAQLPAVYGLYSAVIPSAVYCLFGTASSVHLGPVAIISLLTGSLISQYADEAGDGVGAALDIAAQCSFCVGLLLCIMSLLNMGQFIRLIPHSVMTAFTTGAAMLIGISQLKTAFGFATSVPKVGVDDDVTANWQVMRWFLNNFDGRFNDDENGTHLYRNPYAIAVCICVYLPLITLYYLKRNIKGTKERKKTIWFQSWVMFNNVAPLLIIIIAAVVTKNIVENGRSSGDYYATNLKIIGNVASGLDIARVPRFRMPLGRVFIDVIPMAFIGFMESYSVATSTSATKGELDRLVAGQELFAIGFGNLGGCLFSAFPVAGSFGRSSLNLNAGGRTQLSGVVTTIVIVIALVAASDLFYWIPSAALSAIIYVAITNLCMFSDFWLAWKHSRKDFTIMVVTFVCTVALDIMSGLIVGIIVSLLLQLKETSFSPLNGPTKTTVSVNQIIPLCNLPDVCTSADLQLREVRSAADEETGTKEVEEKSNIEIIRFGNDLSFLTMPRIKGFVEDILIKTHDKMYCLVLDFVDVKHCDWTGLIELKEIANECVHEKVFFVTVNTTPSIQAQLKKYGLKNYLPTTSAPPPVTVENEMKPEEPVWTVTKIGVEMVNCTVNSDDTPV